MNNFNEDNLFKYRSPEERKNNKDMVIHDDDDTSSGLEDLEDADNIDQNRKKKKQKMINKDDDTSSDKEKLRMLITWVTMVMLSFISTGMT